LLLIPIQCSCPFRRGWFTRKWRPCQRSRARTGRERLGCRAENYEPSGRTSVTAVTEKPLRWARTHLYHGKGTPSAANTSRSGCWLKPAENGGHQLGRRSAWRRRRGSHRRTTMVMSKHTPRPKVTRPPVRCIQMATSQKTASTMTANQISK